MSRSLEIVKYVKIEIEENQTKLYFPKRLFGFIDNPKLHIIYITNFTQQDVTDYAIMHFRMKK